MGEAQIQQLVDLGASQAQARAALKKYKDVEIAAERIFDGKFDHVEDGDVDVDLETIPGHQVRHVTPDTDEEMQDEDTYEDDSDGMADYPDYDFDADDKTTSGVVVNADPYAGIFFSKDRKEEVIEIEEAPEIVTVPGTNETVQLLTQGQWMKGCPEGSEQSFLFSLYSKLSSPFLCRQDCGAMIPRHKSNFFALYPKFSTYIDRLRNNLVISCPRCHTRLCMACQESVCSGVGKQVLLSQALFHCADIQGVITGVGLTMLEQLFQKPDQDPSEVENNADHTARNSKRRKLDIISSHDVDDEDNVYYASAGKKKVGTGYDGDAMEDTTGQLKALAAQKAKDETIGKLLGAVRVYLPNVNRQGGSQASDYLPDPTTLAHLRRRFNHVCIALLRNDSLADMSERSVLYFELLEWLETISNHEALASMMAMPIMVASGIKAVNAKNPEARERTVVYEGSAGPRELLEGIAIQAQAALKGLEAHKEQDCSKTELTEDQKRMTVTIHNQESEHRTTLLSDENQKLVRFCRRILATVNAIDRSLRETKGDQFVDRLHASLPNRALSFVGKYRVEANLSDEALQSAYIKWATRARFEYCDLTLNRPNQEDFADPTPHYKFYFNNEARMLARSDIPKRSLAIAKELAILTTNLPVSWGSSIFLKVDETRVDIIKALITGPESTPYVFTKWTDIELKLARYYNGCFLFDIFLGPSYNQSPPNVKFMTTNGGKFRFNPNLYADGKVCLSLLGTWQGPGWVAGKSTLLQVLISIQSMILCDEPYLNEPTWASSSGTPQSKAYSANVRRMVVKTAMLGNLKQPPEPFGDIIETHFRLKGRSIAAQLDEWVKLDDGKVTSPDGGAYASNRFEGSGSSNGFAKDVEELKQLLKQLEDRK